MIQRMSQEIAIIIDDFISIENFNQPNVDMEEYSAFVMALLYKIIMFPKKADTVFNLILNKIFYDDKVFFDLIEKIQ